MKYSSACNEIIVLIKKVIEEQNLDDWFVDYPWLTGFLGNPNSSVWFIGRNPSESAVERVDSKSKEKSTNLQWSCLDIAAQLWRESVTEAGLKDEPACEDCGWRCYITNTVKEPKIITNQNQNSRKKAYWQKQADRWQSVLQAQIYLGSPKVIVASGNQAYEILKYMESQGLKCPSIEKVDDYSYITNRPDNIQNLPPNHNIRRTQYKRNIFNIARKYPYYDD